MTLTKAFTGVHAALLTPRTQDGTLDIDALQRLVRFLLSRGVTAFAVNGATGEFCLTTAHELRAMLRAVRDAGANTILSGVGSTSVSGAMELSTIAADEAADGLLLSMPYFFRYSQGDLETYCRTVVSRSPLPALLYNLPQFSSGLDKQTVRRLITEESNIIGIKDSSGSLEILRDLKAHGVNALKIVGNDSVLAQALTEGICDGVVSGVACALPELILDLFQQAIGSNGFLRASQLLEDVVQQLDQFPAPWALKWAAEAREIIPATFALPISDARTAQANAFSSWLKNWISTEQLGSMYPRKTAATSQVAS